MADSTTPIGSFNPCPTCGIQFAIHKDVEAAWRKSHKTFMCPNGHSQGWYDEPSPNKELETLRARVKELEQQLAESKRLIEQKDAQISDLTTRVELWEPSK